ncbi:hypothetical protein GGTG_14273 [Gaeumannomyces tritici R3-111a-1]|nr:hypothetical protein GGTG_14273 [Gaeumannomyces tritici R3-111a-1]EJT68147.1 hypothetical protein GGTG_14273 [Gaeumannomyces tritici R3-111a-1]
MPTQDVDTDRVLNIAEAVMDGKIRNELIQAYGQDTVYGRLIRELATVNGCKPRKDNEGVVNASKPGHTFRVANGLLYNRDSEGTERLVVPFGMIKPSWRKHTTTNTTLADSA